MPAVHQLGEFAGRSLTQNGIFTEDQIIVLLNNLLPVLQFVHSKQVIHRDIKPENIIRSLDGELVLVDFGAAKTVNPTALSVSGTVIGTAGYTPPEQAVGKPTFASDIYSLGVTCLNLLTQIQPFELFDVIEGEWVWRNYLSSPVSNHLGQVLDKMVSGAVKRRYQSAIEVLQALNPRSHPDNLSSEVGVEYTKLRDALAAKKWKEADYETYLVMLSVVGRKKGDWIRNEELLNFPCTDLHTIDRLWVKYSNGRFGFSVQKKIYLEVGGKLDGLYDKEVWEKLGVRVGWRVSETWIEYSKVTFDTKAPEGHLPAGIPEEWRDSRSNYRYKRLFMPSNISIQLYVRYAIWTCLFSRIETCKM